MKNGIKELISTIVKTENNIDLQINVLVDGFEYISTLMKNVLPMAGGQFDMVADGVKNNISAARSINHNVIDIFNGKGQRATKLKEHYAIIKAIEQYNTRVRNHFNINEYSTLENIIKLFSFSPTTDNNDVNSEAHKVSNFIQEFSKTVFNDTFLLFESPSACGFGDLNPSGFKTGIYRTDKYFGADTSYDGGNLSFVLRGALPAREGFIDGSNVEFAVIADRSSTRIMYYHPFEEEWVMSNVFTFDGMLDAITAEAKRALDQAEKLPIGFNFEDEVMARRSDVEYIFEHAKLLPDRLHFRNNDCNPNTIYTTSHAIYSNYASKGTVLSIQLGEKRFIHCRRPDESNGETSINFECAVDIDGKTTMAVMLPSTVPCVDQIALLRRYCAAIRTLRRLVDHEKTWNLIPTKQLIDDKVHGD